MTKSDRRFVVRLCFLFAVMFAVLTVDWMRAPQSPVGAGVGAAVGSQHFVTHITTDPAWNPVTPPR